jgi:hypothetical protein
MMKISTFSKKEENDDDIENKIKTKKLIAFNFV